MATMAAIRDAIANTIKQYTTTELYTYTFAEEFGETPAIIVEPDIADYQGAFDRGLDEWVFNVYVLCSTKVSSRYGQGLLDKLVSGSGPESIRDILDKHPDLGLTDGTDASLESMRGYGGKFEWSQVPHVGAILKVRVRTLGK